MNNEADVKKAVRKVLDSLPKCYYFMPPANGYGRSGIPDFIGHVNGYFFGVETNFGSRDLTANQTREVVSIVQSGATCWIVRDSTLAHWEVEVRAFAALCS
jgi:hypothetical protein